MEQARCLLQAKAVGSGYNCDVALRRTPHAVYDTQYHLVWSPKYRKAILQGAVAKRVEEVLREIAQAYDITIKEVQVSVDHVYVFCSFPPRLSIAKVITRFKSLSARTIFKEHPQVKRQLWVVGRRLLCAHGR